MSGTTQSIIKQKIFSKTYCPYCHKAKQILGSYKVENKIVELDVENDGSQIQDYLQQLTGQRTVPNIFIKGKHVGGCSEITNLQNNGELDKLING